MLAKHTPVCDHARCLSRSHTPGIDKTPWSTHPHYCQALHYRQHALPCSGPVDHSHLIVEEEALSFVSSMPWCDKEHLLLLFKGCWYPWVARQHASEARRRTRTATRRDEVRHMEIWRCFGRREFGLAEIRREPVAWHGALRVPLSEWKRRRTCATPCTHEPARGARLRSATLRCSVRKKKELLKSSSSSAIEPRTSDNVCVTQCRSPRGHCSSSTL